jgi:nucleoside-diphosphate-sugar epimerase
VTRPEAVGEAFNAGGPRPTRLRDMAQAVVDTVGSGSLRDVAWPLEAEVIETGDYVSDLRKVTDVLGWQPTTDLEQGLAETWSDLALAGRP